MKTDTPVFQITSLLLMLGPIVLFWYIDWYWIVGYYNLYFTYTCYVLYKQYDSDSNYRKKYHFIVYVGLPLIFSFIGLLISVINGFEEIREGDKDFNKNKFKTNDEGFSIQNDIEPKQNNNNPEAQIGKVKELILDFQDVRKLIVQLKENKTPIKFRSIWENYFYYQLKDESQKDFAEESDHWDILDEYLETYGLKKDYDKSKKLHYSYITYIEEIEIDYDQFIEESAIQDYIEACEKNNKDEYKGWVQFDYSYDDYLSWTVEEDFYNDPAAPGWLNSDKSDLIAPLNINDEEIKTEFNLNYKSFEDVIDFNFSEVNFKSQNHLYVFDNKLIDNDIPINEKDLIQELGRIHDASSYKDYKKQAFKLWKEFFEKQLNDYFKDWQEGYMSDDYEFEISDKGEFLIQDVYTTVKYFNDEVEYIHFKLIYNDENETEEGYLSIGFPFIFLNDTPYILFDFPHDYNHWTDNFGNHKELFKSLSFNEVCNKLSMMEFISYQNWKKTMNNNSTDKKNEVVKQYKIKDDNPSSMDSGLIGTKLFKRDITGLMSYFEERPNMERLFNELTHFTRDGYSVEEYLDNTNIMDDEEVKTIIGLGFVDISGFLEDMLKIEENIELRKDYESCLTLSKILLKN